MCIWSAEHNNIEYVFIHSHNHVLFILNSSHKCTRKSNLKHFLQMCVGFNPVFFEQLNSPRIYESASTSPACISTALMPLLNWSDLKKKSCDVFPAKFPPIIWPGFDLFHLTWPFAIFFWNWQSLIFFPFFSLLISSVSALVFFWLCALFSFSFFTGIFLSLIIFLPDIVFVYNIFLQLSLYWRKMIHFIQVTIRDFKDFF